MARTKAGQQIRQHYTELRDSTILSVGVLNRIGDRQGDFLRLQNIAQMLAGKDRNGRSMGRYKTATIKERAKLGYQTGKVDLKRTGRFHESITAVSEKSVVDHRAGSAEINITMGVPKDMEGRLKGFRTGRYGKHGRAQTRPVVGIADSGTPLRNAQERQLRRIALDEARKAFTGAGLTVEARDL